MFLIYHQNATIHTQPIQMKVYTVLNKMWNVVSFFFTTFTFFNLVLCIFFIVNKGLVFNLTCGLYSRCLFTQQFQPPFSGVVQVTSLTRDRKYPRTWTTIWGVVQSYWMIVCCLLSAYLCSQREIYAMKVIDESEIRRLKLRPLNQNNKDDETEEKMWNWVWIICVPCISH